MKRVFLISLLLFSFLCAAKRVLVNWKGVVNPGFHVPWRFRLVGPTTIKGSVKAWNFAPFIYGYITLEIYRINYNVNPPVYSLCKEIPLQCGRKEKFTLHFEYGGYFEVRAANYTTFAHPVFEVYIEEHSKYNYWNWDYY